MREWQESWSNWKQGIVEDNKNKNMNKTMMRA